MVEEQQTGDEKVEAKLTDNNTVTITDAGPCRKKVAIEIPQESVKKVTDEQYGTLQRDAIVPGFRKGRAPRRLIEKRFGKDTSQQIKLKLMAEASEAAIKDKKIDFLREPDIDYEKIELPASGPFKFEFEVEVRPEFELPGLEGIEITKIKAEVAGAQIDEEIERLRKMAGVWTPRDGKIEEGDQVIADLEIMTEGEPQPEKIENSMIYVKENGFAGPVLVKELDKLLIGAKAGDKKETSVEILKTYYMEKYRGKKVELKIHIKDAKWLKPAELNAELFKRLAVSGEAELRDRIRDSLQSRLEQQSKEQLSGEVYKHLLAKTNFDLPVDIVAEQSRAVLQRQYINLMRMGFTKEMIEERLDSLKAGSEQQAKDELKTYFIMNKIGKMLGIEVNDEELNGYIAQIAIEHNQRPERLRQTMEKEGTLETLRLQIRDEKCLSKLLETAKITEVEPPKPVIEKKPAKETKKSEQKPEKKETKAAAEKKPKAVKKKPKETADKKNKGKIQGQKTNKKENRKVKSADIKLLET